MTYSYYPYTNNTWVITSDDKPVKVVIEGDHAQDELTTSTSSQLTYKPLSRTVDSAREELIREINNLANSIVVSADFSVASWAFDNFGKSIEKQKELKIKIEDVL